MLEEVAKHYCLGEPNHAIATKLGIDVHEVDEAVAQLDAVVLLLTASFPQALIARAARMTGDEVVRTIDVIGKHLGNHAALLAFSTSRGFEAPPFQLAASPRTTVSPSPRELPPTAVAEEALDALDFWTSKWE